MATQTVGLRNRLSKISQQSVSQGPPVHWGVEYNNLVAGLNCADCWMLQRHCSPYKHCTGARWWHASGTHVGRVGVGGIWIVHARVLPRKHVELPLAEGIRTRRARQEEQELRVNCEAGLDDADDE
eukprot:scaffold32358_cov51-Phaeocystis_antarctica.AAC.1